MGELIGQNDVGFLAVFASVVFAVSVLISLSLGRRLVAKRGMLSGIVLSAFATPLLLLAIGGALIAFAGRGLPPNDMKAMAFEGLIFFVILSYPISAVTSVAFLYRPNGG
jgi:hypothetical protein